MDLANNRNKIDKINSNLSGKQDKITGAASTITKNNLTGKRVMGTNASGKVAVTEISVDTLSNTTKGIMSGFLQYEHSILGLPEIGYYYSFQIGNLYEEGVQLALGYFGPAAGKVYVRTWASSAVTSDWKEL